MKKANQDVRDAIKKNGLKYWQVAGAIGLNDGNFSRLLRAELSEKRKQEIFNAIELIQNETEITTSVSNKESTSKVTIKKDNIIFDIQPKK